MAAAAVTCILLGLARDVTYAAAPPAKSFRWGADREGGGPYIYPDPKEPSRVIGFEVDLADALGRNTGRAARLEQCGWDQILPDLDRGDIDLGLNGYEYTAQRARKYAASIPYYIYELGLCVREGSPIVSWPALRKPISGAPLRFPAYFAFGLVLVSVALAGTLFARRWRQKGQRRTVVAAAWLLGLVFGLMVADFVAAYLPIVGSRRPRVGVLGGSSADRYMTAEFRASCEIVRFEGTVETFLLVDSGQLDATIQDLPPLEFYLNRLKRYPRLRIVDHPAQPGYYVLYARRADDSLIDEVNRALRKLYHDGTLRRIYEKYGLWNAAQERLPEIWKNWPPADVTQEAGALTQIRAELPLFFRAAGVTVVLAFLSMPLAVAIGLAIALVRAWPSAVLGGSGVAPTIAGRALRGLMTLYVEIVRGTPLAFQLFVVYFVLPDLGVTISAFWSGVLALAVNYSAYEAEIMRLGLQSIPVGQMEAALSLGMSRPLAIRRIILPQAVRTVIPATANDFIALYKDTAVCSVIAVEELSKQYSVAAKSTGLFLHMAIVASVLYLAMSWPLSLLAAWLERRLNGNKIQ